MNILGENLLGLRVEVSPLAPDDSAFRMGDTLFVSPKVYAMMNADPADDMNFYTDSAEYRAFLTAIAVQPDDDTARLVLADWLDENGHHQRAHFIRRSVARPKRFTFGPGESAHAAYARDDAASDLPAFINITLARGYADVRWTTYKGLIESATLTWARWLEVGTNLLEKNWVPEVILTTQPDIVRAGIDFDRGRYWKIAGRLRTEIYVRDCEDHVAALLRLEWPQVARWYWPQPIVNVQFEVNEDGDAVVVSETMPQVGSVVRLLDGTQGVLLAPVDAQGWGPVRPVSPASDGR